MAWGWYICLLIRRLECKHRKYWNQSISVDILLYIRPITPWSDQCLLEGDDKWTNRKLIKHRVVTLHNVRHYAMLRWLLVSSLWNLQLQGHITYYIKYVMLGIWWKWLFLVYSPEAFSYLGLKCSIQSNFYIVHFVGKTYFTQHQYIVRQILAFSLVFVLFVQSSLTQDTLRD